MQKLTVTNSQGEEFSLGVMKPYILQNLVGISDAPVELLSTRGYQQDGVTPAGQYLEARLVSFSVAVMGDRIQQVFEARRNLVRFFSPKDTFTCTYQNDYTVKKFACRVDAMPRFSATQDTGGMLYQVCTVGLVADDPYLLDPDETSIRMAIAEPALRFPLVFSPSILFGYLSNAEMSITNPGDIKAPVRIRIHGGTVDPKIENSTTGEYIQVNKEILAGEILEIRTGYGNKRVEIIDENGTRTNAFQYIDLSSTFWQLVPGENTVVFTAESGLQSAPIYLYYSGRYVGA